MSDSTVMLLGDSLTVPLPRQMAAALAARGVKARLIGTQGTAPYNHEGHGGWNIERLAAAFDGWVKRVGVPSLVVVCMGTNNVVGWPMADVDLELFNLRAFLVRLAMLGCAVVLCTIPPTTIRNSPGVDPFNAGVRRIMLQAQSDPAMPKRMRLADVNRAVSIGDLSDGVHLNASGQAKMVATIADQIAARAPPSSRTRGSAVGLLVLLGLALYALEGR